MTTGGSSSAQAGTEFRSVSSFSLSALRDHWKGAVRCGHHGYGLELNGKELKNLGMTTLPAGITA